MPPTVTMRTGPACPWCTMCSASGWAHASSKVVDQDGLHASDVGLVATLSSRGGGDLNSVSIPSAAKICADGVEDCVVAKGSHACVVEGAPASQSSAPCPTDSR